VAVRWQLRPLPFVSLAPAIVVVLGTLAATLFGVLSFRTLSNHSDEYSLQEARALGALLSERLRAIPSEQRAIVIERAARRAGVEILLVDTYGAILVDSTLRPPLQTEIVRMLINEAGITNTQLGRVSFAATPVRSPRELSSLLVFARAPKPPTPAMPMVTSLGLLSLLFIGAAMLVAYGLARNVHADVDYVRERISAMSAREAEPSGQTIPVRSTDAVGVLTSAFNDLVMRFSQAEKRYREDLRRTLTFDRDRGAFLAALSHELRTPLNAILGFTDVLLAEVDGPLSQEAAENLTIVHTSGRHLAALIDDILDLSAIESGQLRLTRTHVDVLQVAETVVKEIHVTAKAKGLELKLTGEKVFAWADQRRLRQILNNVIGNAVKFTQQGHVTVEVSKKGRRTAQIAVSDTGPGIAPSDQATIFEEYRQSGEQRWRRSGTGLGLAISRRLIEMHGGAIRLESSLGRGSTFTLLLPSQHETDRSNPEAVRESEGSIGTPEAPS
jgi:signal transduction histidine kinase